VAAANRATSQPFRPEPTNRAPADAANPATPAPVTAKPDVTPEAPRAEVPPGQKMVLPVAAGSGGHGSVSAEIIHPPARVLAPSVVVPPAAVSAPGPAARVDDLTRIRGIDTDLAARLKSLGISSFAEISGWKPADVARINTALNVKGRVEQENWIEQAQILGKGEDTFYSKGGKVPAAPIAQPGKDEGQSKPIVAVPAAIPATAIVQPAQAAKAATSPDVESRAAFADPKPLGFAIPAAVAGPKPAPIVVSPSPVAPVVAPAVVAARAPAAVGRDSLQRIAGVNSEVEKLLQVQGITRYSRLPAGPMAT
jgi:predicted flap endonuclease-1-like 5' DNA nuclease